MSSDGSTTCSQPPSAQVAADWSKFHQAGAQAYYACRYFASVENTNFWRNIIAGIQAATQIYFADKQYEIAKQAQDRLDADAAINRDRSGTTFGQFTKGIACEDAMRDEACAKVIPEPDINDIRRQAEAEVRRTYAPMKKKILDCTPVHCMKAACNTLAKLANEEAKAILSLTNQMMRQAIAKWETDKAAALSFKYQMLGLGRGYVGNSTALMAAAGLNTQAAAQINPYSGAIQAVNSIASTARSLTLQEANNFAGMGINVGRQGTPTSVSGSQISRVETGFDNQYRSSFDSNVMQAEMQQYQNFSDPSTFYSDGGISGEAPSTLNTTGDWNPLQNMG